MAECLVSRPRFRRFGSLCPGSIRQRSAQSCNPTLSRSNAHPYSFCCTTALSPPRFGRRSECTCYPLLPAYSRGLLGVRRKVGMDATTPIRAGSSRPTNIQHKFDIPGYGKIDLRIFGDRDLRGDNDVQRPPLAKCIKRSRLARCVKPYCLRPRCLMCVRWPVGTRRKFEGAVELRRSGRAVQVRKLRRQA